MDVEEKTGGSGGSTPVQDEQAYSDAENQDMEVDGSDDEQKPTGKNARTADSDDEYVSEGGEFEREEVQRDTDDEDDVEREEVERHSDDNISDAESKHSDDDDDNAQNGPDSPAGSPNRSRSVSPAKSGSVHSRSGSPQSPVGSPMSVQKSGSDHSRSPSPAHSRRSASPAHSRSRSGSAASRRSQSGSPARSRSGSRASGSGSHRSRSGSPASRRSRSGSAASHRSGSGSPRRSRSGSSGSRRSRSGSHRSGSGSPINRSRSGSAASRRSGSGSPRRSRSGSAASARSRSGSRRSRSGSAASHRSGSAGSRKSGSKSPRSQRSRSRSADSHRSNRSGSAGSHHSRPASRRSRSNSPVPSVGSSPDSPIVKKKKEKLFSDSEASDSESEQIKRKVRKQIQSDSEDEDEKLKNSIKRISTGLESDDEGSGNENKTAEVPRKIHKKILSDSEDEAPKAKDSDDEDEESDKETGEKLIADIFGSSDEDEEFEGFGEADVEAAPKKKDKKQDDNEENSAPADDEVVPDMSDDENDENIRDSQRDDYVSDFDAMLEKKKAERQANRRKRKDVDIINDNDDLIADMVQKMKQAAEEDRQLNSSKKAATKKLKYLPFVNSQLKKADLHIAFLDCGILSAMTEWLAPLPDRSLPHLTIRDCFVKILIEFPPIGTDSLKSSGIGKAIMYLYKHPKETKENKSRAGRLINEWSRPIFNLTSNYSMLSKEEREERDYQQLPKKQRVSEEGEETPGRDIDKAIMSQEETALRPGDKGWVYRARVPMPSVKDYVVRPKWNIDENPQGSTKKGLSRYEKQMRAFQEKKRRNKNQRAVTISIEGRNMSL